MRTLRTDPEGDDPAQRFLVLFEGDSATKFPLPAGGQIVIGRAVDAQIRLNDAAASRQHARLVLKPDEIRISDLGSRNGTRVNGERLQAARALAPGDVITICKANLVLHRGAERTAGPYTSTLMTGAADPVAGDGPVPTLQIGERTIVVADPAMVHIYGLIERLAKSELPVLVQGQTGTGKEMVAAALHHWSARRAGPLLNLNCAALPEGLVESELFGHEKGAFSGAAGAKTGLLESARGGTVFLDEVGELPLGVQAKLLRVLETRRMLRLGDVRERPIDIRIVAATNRDLEAEIRAGRFRRDLYFRLSVATVALPPLRDRPRELPLLARSFLQAACAQAGRTRMELSPATLERLRAYGWPGNIRELKNTMEYVAATHPGPVLEPRHLPAPLRDPEGQGPDAPAAEPAEGPSAGFRPLEEEIRELERSRIQAALEATGGVQTRAAALIGMPLRTFIKRMNEYGLSPRGSTRRGE